MLDELAHAGAEHLDPEFVARYDRKQGSVPDKHAATALDILAEHGVDEASTVVDLAAGTGRFTVPAARRYRRIVAVDVSPAMVEHLRRRVGEAGLDNVDVVQAGFLTYEHQGPPADAVYTRNALHQLPDFWKVVALDRIAKLLRPGGVLRVHDLIYDFEPHQATEVFAGWFGRAAADPAVGYTAEDYAEHIRSEHSTFRWLFEPMLVAAGFEIVEADCDVVFGAYTCVKR